MVPPQLQDSHELHDLVLTTSVPERSVDFKANLPAHLAWAKENTAKYTMKCHGPFLDENNANSGNGAYSLLVEKSSADTLSIAQQDPFHKTGIRSFEIRHWLKVKRHTGPEPKLFSIPVSPAKFVLRFAVFSTPAEGKTLADIVAQEQQHLQFLESLHEQNKLGPEGPFCTEEGEPNGAAIYCLEVDSPEEARMIAQEDPLHSSGLRMFEIRKWAMVLDAAH